MVVEEETYRKKKGLKAKSKKKQTAYMFLSMHMIEKARMMVGISGSGKDDWRKQREGSTPNKCVILIKSVYCQANTVSL